MEIDAETVTKLLGDGGVAAILIYAVKTLWTSKQQGDKALIEYLQASKKEDLAAQQKQIESNDKLTDILGDLKESIEKRHAEDDQRYNNAESRLTAVEREVFPQTRRTVKPKLVG